MNKYYVIFEIPTSRFDKHQISTYDTQDKILPCAKSLSVDCTLSQWSPCSTTCGPGTKTRYVEKQAQNGGQECCPLSQECNLKKCPGK